MSLLQKPKNIYHKELPKVGRAANPNLTYEDEYKKLNYFQIIIKGLLHEEMSPKQYKKYDNFIMNFKVYGLTFLITYALFYAAFHSNFTKGPYEENKKPAFLQKQINDALDFLEETFEELKTFI